MAENYLDFRYLQLRKTPSSLKCAIFSLLAGIALSLPFLLSLFFKNISYFHIQPYYDHFGKMRINLTMDNPYGLDFTRYLGDSFKRLALDLAIFLAAINLWTFFMCFLLNDTKKRWQIFPITITVAFTLPVVLFTFSLYTSSKFFFNLNSVLNNPFAIYFLLSIALSIIFGIKRIMYLIIPGLIGYFIGYLILVYVTNQVANIKFISDIPTEKMTNWLTLIQITKNLIWGFFIGIGVYATYGQARKLADSIAHFEDTTPR
uniref:Uncharacterized protein n=1 Tax=candidate division WOR-3 bacterium TaxID=2052148 RepID=A0A7C6EBV5_UNCW3